MGLLASPQLKADDVIELVTKEGVLRFVVLQCRNIYNTPQPGRRKRIADVQVKVRPIPGTAEPVLLFPAAKLWTVRR